MEILCTPAVFDKNGGEVIEQRAVNRLLGSHAKVAGRGDESLAEMMQPHPINIDASRERIARAGDRSSELQSAAAVGKGRTSGATQDFEEPARRFLTGV